MKKDNFYKEGYEDFYKKNEYDLIWWTNSIENIGTALFSFDKKKYLIFGKIIQKN